MFFNDDLLICKKPTYLRPRKSEMLPPMSLQTTRALVALLSVFFFLPAPGPFSQPLNKKLNDVVLPAPNAGSLGKYGDVPVSYFTGVPNVSIPLYTVQDGPLALPVSLDYHASGIRVAEPASWVGLGWSLNAGGIITRTVLGTPDDSGVSFGYYWYGNQLLNPELAVPPSTQIPEVARGQRDGEPDLFTFSFAGYSGKFMFDKDRIARFIPRSDLKIEVVPASTNSQFVRFVIITPDGVRYTFGNLPGESTTDNPGIEVQQVPTQMKPTRIAAWLPVRLHIPKK